jgi:hypothetical protein
MSILHATKVDAKGDNDGRQEVLQTKDGSDPEGGPGVSPNILISSEVREQEGLRKSLHWTPPVSNSRH